MGILNYWAENLLSLSINRPMAITPNPQFRKKKGRGLIILGSTPKRKLWIRRLTESSLFEQVNNLRTSKLRELGTLLAATGIHPPCPVSHCPQDPFSALFQLDKTGRVLFPRLCLLQSEVTPGSKTSPGLGKANPTFSAFLSLFLC